MKLFQDKVLVEHVKTEEKVGSLFMVKGNSYEPIEGVVINRGPGKVFCAKGSDDVLKVTGSTKTQLQIGDRALCPRHPDYQIMINNKWYSLYKETDILGVLSEVN